MLKYPPLELTHARTSIYETHPVHEVDELKQHLTGSGVAWDKVPSMTQ